MERTEDNPTSVQIDHEVESADRLMSVILALTIMGGLVMLGVSALVGALTA